MLSLNNRLIEYEKEGLLSFHTPGHKGKAEFFVDLHFPAHDLTELPGLDMLHAPEGVIKRAQERASEIYGSESSFFLVNGGTVGNQGMFMALADSRGSSPGKVLVERQSHRSVMGALVLSGLEPDYIRSIVHPEFKVPLGIAWEGLNKLPSYSAIHLTYPSYYGTVIDLAQIIKEREEYSPQMSVLVDQAHGAHFLHDLFPAGALELGADIVMHSIHKTLSALTQGAMLHMQGPRISLAALKRSLEMLQSSSPNYLMMASLERAVETALNRKPWELLYEAVEELHYRAGKVVRILNKEDEGKYGIKELDWSKIFVNTSSLGIGAYQAVEFLRTKYKIQSEFWDEENILFYLGIGNTPEEVQQLTQGLLDLEKLKGQSSKVGFSPQEESLQDIWLSGKGFLPPRRLTPREAFIAPKVKVPLKESIGKIVGESISPYPPGIPLIVMGEEMTQDILEIILAHKGKWQGWEEPLKSIWVIEEG